MNGWREIQYPNPNYLQDGDTRQYLTKQVMVGNGFIYNGNNTNDILPDVELILVGTNASGNIPVTSGTRVATSQTLYKDSANEYGFQKNNTSFSYSLIKNNGSLFNDEEQIIVESWLTGRQFSDELIIFDCDYKENDENKENHIRAIYKGMFVSTTWNSVEGGFWGCTFSFEAVSSYPYKKYVSEKYIINTTESESNEPFEINLDCLTTEYGKYIYPMIIISSNETIDTSVVTDTNFSLTNVTDNNNTMKMRLIARNLNMYIDNENCTITDEAKLEHYNYSSILWNDIKNIYWLKLKKGINKLLVTGNCTIQFKYNYPVKLAGGWL